MAEVLFSSEDITVLGGKARRDVEITVGSPGVRGSRIYIGDGRPTDVDLSQEVLIFDLYINLLASSDEYLYLYQYLNVDGINQWVRILRLIPNTFLITVRDLGFTGGQATYNLPIVNVISFSQAGNITARNFNVQHTVLNDKPVASSITNGDLSILSSITVLPITVNAAEFDGTTWSSVDGSRDVQFLVTLA